MGGLRSTPSPSCKAPGLLVTARPAPSWPCNQGASVAPALGTSALCCGELTRPCDVDLGASGNTKGHVSLYTGHGPGGGGAVLCAARGFRDFTGMLCPFYGQGNRDLERVSLPGCPAVSGRNRSAGRTALGHCTASSPDSRRRACNLLCSPWALLCLRDPGDSLRPEQGGVQAPGWVSSGACIPLPAGVPPGEAPESLGCSQPGNHPIFITGSARSRPGRALQVGVWRKGPG